MTPEEQNHELRLWLGWKYHPASNGGTVVNPWERPSGGYTSVAPNFLDVLHGFYWCKSLIFRMGEEGYSVRLENSEGVWTTSWYKEPAGPPFNFNAEEETAERAIAKSVLIYLKKWREK